MEERMYSRRDLAKIALGALSGTQLLAKPNSVVRGVAIGVQSYSLRDRPLEAALAAMTDAGISYCELWEGHIVPPTLTRKGQQEWRENIAIEQFQAARQRFSAAGVKIYAFNYNFQDDFTDREIERGFAMAKALRAQTITASSSAAVVKRVNPFAAKHDMVVALHNDDGTNPDHFSTPENFDAAMRDNSHVRVSLDIGNFVAAGFDPVKYIEQYGNLVAILHIKDRKKDHGPNVVFGEGDTPIGAVLKLLASSGPAVPAMIECEYGGTDRVEELRRCYDFCRQALRKR
jgi:sugar phosphate isomerase/epimerase